MKLLSWNIRGIGNSDSCNELSNICRQYHPDLVCILEPMISFDIIPSSYWVSLNLRLISMNERGSLIPNMWLLGAPHIVALIILLSEQQITIQLDMEGVTSQLSFIFTATTARKRKSLWSELLQLRQSTLVAWMAIGDFNSVLGAHECMGGQLPIRSSCEDFRSVTELCNFAHMDTTGAFYTWARGRGSNHIERRLDRALCDTCWNGSWQESSCIAIPEWFQIIMLFCSRLKNLVLGDRSLSSFNQCGFFILLFRTLLQIVGEARCRLVAQCISLCKNLKL